MALSDLIEFRVEFGLGSLPGTGVYGTSLYGTGTYGASTGGGIQWTDMTGLCHGFTTKTGKNLAQPILKRFRTGTAIFTMDNTSGAFVPGSQTIPGFLQLRPGRHVRISARPSWYSQECDPLPANTTWQGVTGRTWVSHGDLMKLPTGCGYPFLIDDGTTWTGVTGRTWTSHGDAMFLDVEDGGYSAIWQGRIDTIDNRHRRGDLTAIVKATDAFAEFAANDTAEQTPVGAGETTSARITRILDYYGWADDRRDVATDGANTVQAINFAQDMLTNLQLTAEAEGGSLWMGADGDVKFRAQDWQSVDIDYEFGGVAGLPVRTVTPAWSSFDVINEAHFARTGGTEQVATDSTSILLLGRRTTRRLDLINDSDTDVLALATRAVNKLGTVKQYMQEASVLVQDDDTVDFVLNVFIGALLEITTDTIHGWSQTMLATVIAISDEVTPQGWIMTLGLSDASQPNEYGDYSRDEFSDAYHLGGEAPAVII